MITALASQPNENTAKVLFLDIDGVVNCKDTFKDGRLFPLDPEMAFRVGKIQLYTDCQVVLSSSWKNHPESVENVERRVVKLLDKTPNLSGIRGDEVNKWLEQHPEVKRYAILDDDSDFHPDQPLFKTSWDTGITDEIMYKVILYLNGDDSAL